MKKAFSLIELSIVLLIIGILIAGVTQSSRLIQQFRIQTARNLTAGSPVHSIKNLSLWYESTMESSFAEAEAEDGQLVTNWYDINSQSSYKTNAAGSGNSRPTYRENVFNSLPALRFDGAGDHMNIADGSFLVGTNYTIFIVCQRRTGNASYVLGGNSASFSVGYYHASGAISFFSGGSGILYDLPTYTVPEPTIVTASFETGALRMWVNGGVNPDEDFITDVDPLTAWVSPAIGHVNGNYYFNGDVAEIIIFSRLLKTDERQAVESYLGKKYNIKIS